MDTDFKMESDLGKRTFRRKFRRPWTFLRVIFVAAVIGANMDFASSSAVIKNLTAKPDFRSVMLRWDARGRSPGDRPQFKV